MSLKNEIIIKEIVAAVRKLIRAVYIDTARMSRQFGVTGAQGAVLRALYDQGPKSSAELSRRLGVTPSNMTGLIDRLEKKGFVKRVREREDRRVVRIELTAQGGILGRKLPDPIEQKVVSKLIDMDVQHVQLIADVMNEMLTVVDIDDTEMEYIAFPEIEFAGLGEANAKHSG